jgi:hypothetical protein
LNIPLWYVRHEKPNPCNNLVVRGTTAANILHPNYHIVAVGFATII